jgi:hypothetical protein
MRLNRAQCVYICLNILFYFTMMSCQPKKVLQEEYTLSPDSIRIISEKWQNDSTGCGMQRNPNLAERLIRQVKLVGKDTAKVIEYFGPPNHITFNKKKHTYVYFLECYGEKRISYSNFYFDFENDSLFAYQHAIF